MASMNETKIKQKRRKNDLCFESSVSLIETHWKINEAANKKANKNTHNNNNNKSNCLS